MLIKMNDDDDNEADPGPMPLLEDCDSADERERLEASQRVLAQSRAVRKQIEQAQKIQQARLAEEVRRARDKEEAAMAATSALLAAQIKRKQSIEAAPEPETLYADAHDVDVQGADVEMEGAHAEEGCGNQHPRQARCAVQSAFHNRPPRRRRQRSGRLRGPQVPRARGIPFS